MFRPSEATINVLQVITKKTVYRYNTAYINKPIMRIHMRKQKHKTLRI